jgi:hypothetical protein
MNRAGGGISQPVLIGEIDVRYKVRHCGLVNFDSGHQLPALQPRSIDASQGIEP